MKEFCENHPWFIVSFLTLCELRSFCYWHYNENCSIAINFISTYFFNFRFTLRKGLITLEEAFLAMKLTSLHEPCSHFWSAPWLETTATWFVLFLLSHSTVQPYKNIFTRSVKSLKTLDLRHYWWLQIITKLMSNSSPLSLAEKWRQKSITRTQAAIHYSCSLIQFISWRTSSTIFNEKGNLIIYIRVMFWFDHPHNYWTYVIV